MNNNRIALICDSGCDVPEDFVKEHDIRILPLTLNYSDGSYQSGINITTDEVVRRLAQEIPTTSLPSPQTIENVFEKAREDGYDKAVFIGISSALSSTFQTTMMVGDGMENFDVVYVDSKNIGLGAGLTVMAAAEMIEENVAFELLQGKLDELASKTSVYFAVQTLTYLNKGGRISDTVYRLGSMLNIKPVLSCSPEGNYITAKKTRGMDNALAAEVSMTTSRMRDYSRIVIGICCTTKYDTKSRMENLLYEKMPGKIERIVQTNISPALVVHTGPELVGVAAQPDWHDLTF